MKRIWKNNGLGFVLLAFFLATWLGGQFATGRADYNNERADHALPPLSVVSYLSSAHFLEATAENWESEFFQMYLFVMLTVCLTQMGSAESNDPEVAASEAPLTRKSPWPARRGGWVRKLYSHSLSFALLGLFFISFTLHALGGHRLFNEELAMAGKPGVSLTQFLMGARFWFPSFQNWQSEFLAILSMVVLTIFLRERGSPESKSVNSPNSAHE